MSDQTFPTYPGCALAPEVRGDGRCRVLGVVNVTPDSFSDGGRYSEAGAALAHAHDLLEAGADIIDVGGQSTRPGAPDLSVADEWARIEAVVDGLVREGAVVSVDTLHSEVARRALDAGVAIINDVSGTLADPAMAAVLANYDAAYICQHMRATPSTMDGCTDYPDGVVEGVLAELAERLETLARAGVDLGRVILDPGLGFAKTSSQTWELLAATSRLVATGFPVLIGASRKRFLAAAGGQEATGRDPATAAVSALAASAGAWGVRVHDVAVNVQATRVGCLWKEHS